MASITLRQGTLSNTRIMGNYTIEKAEMIFSKYVDEYRRNSEVKDMRIYTENGKKIMYASRQVDMMIFSESVTLDYKSKSTYK